MPLSQTGKSRFASASHEIPSTNDIAPATARWWWRQRHCDRFAASVPKKQTRSRIKGSGTEDQGRNSAGLVLGEATIGRDQF